MCCFLWSCLVLYCPLPLPSACQPLHFRISSEALLRQCIEKVVFCPVILSYLVFHRLALAFRLVLHLAVSLFMTLPLYISSSLPFSMSLPLLLLLLSLALSLSSTLTLAFILSFSLLLLCFCLVLLCDVSCFAMSCGVLC